MRTYKVTATLPDEGGEFCKFGGSQSEAAAIKRDLFEQYKAAGLKRGSIQTEEVDVPTNKAGLIPWLNENLAS